MRRIATALPLTLLGTAAALVLFSSPAAAAGAEASTTNFIKLKNCESGGDYSTNTGNGYYGAYQFDLRTWHGLGQSGRPDQAPFHTQDQAARRLQSERGWHPWPACSRANGLL